MRDRAVYRSRSDQWSSASYRLVRLAANFYRLEFSEWSATAINRPTTRCQYLNLDQAVVWNAVNAFGIDVEAMEYI